jgi:hypothetical protein
MEVGRGAKKAKKLLAKPTKLELVTFYRSFGFIEK